MLVVPTNTELVSYLLPLGAVLVLGIAIAAVIGVVVLLVSRVRPGRRQESKTPPVMRRCEQCRNRWPARPEDNPGVLTLRRRRRVRRRRRARNQPIPDWAKARGWHRCPSCLSSQVRTSRDDPLTSLPRRPGLQVLGLVAAAAGLALVANSLFG